MVEEANVPVEHECDVSTVGPSSPRDVFEVEDGSESGEGFASSMPGSKNVGSGYKLDTRAVLVTWSKSRITDVSLFEQNLVAMMPYGTEMYGCKELHKDGTPHYHVVLRFPKRHNWGLNAKQHFVMRTAEDEEDTTAIHFTPPTMYQREADFVRKTQAYCMKYEHNGAIMLGKYIEILSKDETLKRKFIAVHAERDRDSAKRMLMEADPIGFAKHYPSYMSYLDGEKRKVFRPGFGMGLSAEEALPWRVPDEMREWQEKYLLGKFEGRPVPLIIVGGPRLGKSQWAQQAGSRPMVMSCWNLRKYDPDATHLVLNDVDFRRFGSGGHSYWRDVLGCQPEFDASDKYCRTKTLQWLFPVIVTCNADNDPRLVPEIQEYLKASPSVVVEITEKLF
ncbi:hypothetical protein PtrSN002B_012169 [Pyrenophora tritici-repentis]|nr:hypothetical protein PtrSN002B_012169 [Pyrenophora tritici-repentis]